MNRKLFLSLLFTGVISIAGCGGSYSSNSSQTSSIASVNVTCSPTNVSTGSTTQCSASVAGTGDYSSGVDWSVDSGTISGNGLYTAPSSAPSAGSGTVTVTATSKQDGSKRGSVILNVGNAASPGTATLSVNATSIAFGTVALNTASTQSVTLTSTGTGAVTISAASVTGAGFSISGATFPITLNANQTATLYAVFDPTVAGSATGQLSIASNSSSGATTVVSLTGTGGIGGAGQAVSYEVNLSWDAPASSPDPVAGYNIFRAPTGTTSYQQLNTLAVTDTTYIDANVQNGTTYDYMVQSIDSTGNSSPNSDTATVTVPQ
jgi:hypothetical protein